MPLEVHLAIWRGAARRMLAQSRYAALLISLHGTSLYERRAPAPAIPEYLTEQRSLQSRLSAGLDAGEVDVNRRLLGAWDHLSLALCLGWGPEHTIPGVPGFGDLLLADGRLTPWPFAGESVVLETEARRLAGRFSSDAALAVAYQEAPWERLEFRLSRER
jgi:hypothetical protein